MPVFTSIGLALGSTVAASATGIGAFGVGLGATAAVAGIAGTSIASNISQSKSANKAAQQARQQNDAALATVREAQSTASSQAQEAIKARRRSATQTVFTSPLGITEKANINKKILLGQ